MPQARWTEEAGWFKQCSNCKTVYIANVKSWTEAYKTLRKNFSPKSTTKDELESGCFRCRAIAEMRIRFGVDVEALIRHQDGKCAICETRIEFNTGINSTSACIDHNHETGSTRGVLCRACNLGLGHFKDDSDLLISAAQYLQRND